MSTGIVILTPKDFTVEVTPDGLRSINYNDSAEAKFTAAGWDAIKDGPDHHPSMVIQPLASGGVKLWIAHPISLKPPYKNCPICHQPEDLFGSVHHRPPPCFKCHNETIVIGDRDRLFYHCNHCHNEWEIFQEN